MEMPESRRSRRYIHVDVHGPQPEVQGPPPDVQLFASSKIKIKLGAGGNVPKSSILKVLNPPAIVTWIIDIGDLGDSTEIEFELYDRRSFHLPKKLLIGHTESKNMSDLVKGAHTSTISVLNNAQSEICTLNAYRINIREAVRDGFNATNEPRTPSARAGEFLQVVDAIFSTVSEIHPIATVVWGILSFGLKIHKKQEETKALVVELCTTMKSIHQEVNSDGALEKQEYLTGIYNSMFEKTFECCIFINHYMKKGFFSMMKQHPIQNIDPHITFIGRLFIFNVSDMVAEYQKEFNNLKRALSSALAKDTNYVTNKICEIVEKTDWGVDTLNVDVELNKLLAQHKGAVETSPKCQCLEGTRIETLKYLNSWIECPDGVGCVLWCHGLAGTGKSSLAGTLHDKVINFKPAQEESQSQTRSRLGAFICYDRSTAKSSVLHLIPAIAYSLGQLDERIGSAIAKVVKAHGPGIGGASVKTQYDGLLSGPLNTVSELVNEGPLVIIIDGLDECRDIAEPNLALDVFTALSEGFKDLTFMRLVVFSRRVEPITEMFEKSIAVHPFPLNESLDPILNDIQYFIESELVKAGKNSDGFCKVLQHYPKATQQLASQANGLFIWASIACRYLLQHKSQKAMEVLLKTNTSDNAAGHSNTGDSALKALKALHDLYITALDEASGGDPDLKECIKKVLGAIIVAKTPLTQDDLDKLVLDEKDTSAQDILDKLGSVVEKYDDDDKTDTKRGGFIRLIHKSFDDFLTHQSSYRKDLWFIDIEDHKRKLAQQCLSVLIDFLGKWTEGSNNHSHIQDYTLLGPLWHIKCFDKSNIKDLCVLFKNDLSAKWFKVAAKAGKEGDLLREIIQVLHWVNSLQDVDCNFRQLVYHACQRAESALLSTERQPTIESQNVFWHNILPYPSHLLFYWVANFSVSADSQVLIATSKHYADTMSWKINVHIQEEPALKPTSSFFKSEESLLALKDPQYHVLGHLIACQSMFVGDPSEDDHETHWEVINSNGLFTAQSGDQCVSAFISISDIQTSHCHHYLFKDLKHYHLLLYAAGFIVIDIQITVLMRINVNATADQCEWKNIVKGDALQVGSLSIPHAGKSSPLLVVSQDGLTLAHLSRLVDGPGDLWMLQCWDTTTGLLTYSSSLNIHQQKPMSLVLSASGTTSIIITSENQKTFLHIVSFDNSGTVYEVIDCGNLLWSKETFQVVASFPNEQKIAYLTEDAIAIRDIQAKNDIFYHYFPPTHKPSNITITPDGKTLLTIHPYTGIIRSWHVEGF